MRRAFEQANLLRAEARKVFHEVAEIRLPQARQLSKNIRVDFETRLKQKGFDLDLQMNLTTREKNKPSKKFNIEDDLVDFDLTKDTFNGAFDKIIEWLKTRGE